MASVDDANYLAANLDQTAEEHKRTSGSESVVRAIIDATDPSDVDGSIAMLEHIRIVVDLYLEQGYHMQALVKTGISPEDAFEMLRTADTWSGGSINNEIPK